MTGAEQQPGADPGGGVTVAEAFATALREHQGANLSRAEAIYRRILAAAPDHAGSLHYLGLIECRSGRAEAGLRRLQRSLALAPDNADYLMNLGAVLLELDRAAEAEAAYGRAIAIRPHDAEAQVARAVARARQGRLDDAERGYREAIRLAPDHVQAHVNLAGVLDATGRYEAAEAACRGAVALAPDLALAHNNLGGALQAQGRFDEARAAYERALALKPDFVQPLVRLAAAGRAAPDGDLIERLSARLRAGALSTEDRCQLLFARGKALDDLSRYEAAFDSYREGNALRTAERRFDHRAVADLIDALIATFDRDFFAARRDLGSDSERPIFIVGMPRSGTTLVEQIVASHPRVFGAGELDDFNILTRSLADRVADSRPYPCCAASIDPPTVDLFARKYLAHLERLSGGAERVTDKMPLNFLHLGLIALLFPRARVIHCRREPLDTCLSCYFQNFTEALSFADDLAGLGRYYGQYRRLMAHWERVLPLPLLEVRYERLVAETEKVSREMLAFCGLEWDDACRVFHRSRRAVHTASLWQARQPVYARSVGRWRHYAPYLAPLRRALKQDAGRETGR